MLGWWLVAAAGSGGGLPADVRAFLARREQCAHWAGEEPYDRARAAQIAAAMGRLRCGGVDAAQDTLRRRHAHRPAALRALDAEPDS